MIEIISIHFPIVFMNELFSCAARPANEITKNANVKKLAIRLMNFRILLAKQKKSGYVEGKKIK